MPDNTTDRNARLTSALRRARMVEQRLYAMPGAIQIATKNTDRTVLANNITSIRLEMDSLIDVLEEELAARNQGGTDAMSYRPPLAALRTSCITGCSSTVEWMWDAGEPTTYWHPGYPDIYIAESGCEISHLEMLCSGDEYERHLGTLIYLHENWLCAGDGADLSMRSSRIYLGLRPYRSLRDYVRVLEDLPL